MEDITLLHVTVVLPYTYQDKEWRASKSCGASNFAPILSIKVASHYSSSLFWSGMIHKGNASAILLCLSSCHSPPRPSLCITHQGLCLCWPDPNNQVIQCHCVLLRIWMGWSHEVGIRSLSIRVWCLVLQSCLLYNPAKKWFRNHTKYYNLISQLRSP